MGNKAIQDDTIRYNMIQYERTRNDRLGYDWIRYDATG